MNNDYILESFKELSTELVTEIRELESFCNKKDSTHYQLFLENTLNADREIDFVYTCRLEGKLISFLLLFFPDVKDIEVYGFTHPDFRRKGLFTRLIHSTGNVLEKYDNHSFLFVCDLDSEDGIAFLKKKDTTLEETEYMMEINWDFFNKYIKGVNHLNFLHMKRASMEQLNEISQIASRMYGEEKVKSIDFVRQTLLSDNREQLIGLIDDKIIGICAVGREEDFVMINGLAVDKEYLGKGFGRELLNQIITYVTEKYHCALKLEVSSINDKAFNLYKSVGFMQNESYGYFRDKSFN